MARVSGAVATPKGGMKGGSGGSKTRIANLQKPPKQAKSGGVSTPFSNRVVPGIGGKR